MVRHVEENLQKNYVDKVNKPIKKEDYQILTRKRSGSFHLEDYLQKNDIVISNGSQEVFLDFAQLPIQESMKASIKLEGYTEPSPIQAASWPSTFKGKDVLAIAKTGSGKTCGYLLPGMCDILKKARATRQELANLGPSMLIMAPTRELCQQIFNEAQKFGKSSGIESCAIYGGASKGPQIGDLFRGKDIVVATPGRLIDFLQMQDFKTGKTVAKLDRTQILVLDEADRMLDMGFEADIKRIMTYMKNKDRQTMFFTATWPKEVQRIAEQILKNPVVIRIGNPNQLIANKDIQQNIMVMSQQQKFENLKLHLKKIAKDQRLIVFCNKKHECQNIARNLFRDGFAIAAIHGDLDQAQRENILNRFKTGQDPLLMATDVAARGLDIKDVEVLNYDFPNTVEDYIHRIGRSGRAGAQGCATTFFTMDDQKYAQGLVKILTTANQKVDQELQNIAQSFRSYGGGKRGPKQERFGYVEFKLSDQPNKVRKL